MCILSVVNTLLCPGNANRISREITKWMPEFPYLSFFDKLRICIVSTWQHFTSLPNVIFLLFSFTILILMWKKEKNFLKRVVAGIPFFLSLLSTCYYFVTQILVKRTINYKLPKTLPIEGSGEFYEQYIIVVLAIVYLVAVTYSLWILFKSQNKNILICGVYLLSLISRFCLIFSPTMLASGTRVYFFFYMGMVGILCQLLELLQEKKWKCLCYIGLAIGIFVNIAMTFLVQQKY